MSNNKVNDDITGKCTNYTKKMITGITNFLSHTHPLFFPFLFLDNFSHNFHDFEFDSDSLSFISKTVNYSVSLENHFDFHLSRSLIL